MAVLMDTLFGSQLCQKCVYLPFQQRTALEVNPKGCEFFAVGEEPYHGGHLQACAHVAIEVVSPIKTE